MSHHSGNYGGQCRIPLTMADKIQLCVWATLAGAFFVYAIVVFVAALFV